MRGISYPGIYGNLITANLLEEEEELRVVIVTPDKSLTAALGLIDAYDFARDIVELVEKGKLRKKVEVDDVNE